MARSMLSRLVFVIVAAAISIFWWANRILERGLVVAVAEIGAGDDDLDERGAAPQHPAAAGKPASIEAAASLPRGASLDRQSGQNIPSVDKQPVPAKRTHRQAQRISFFMPQYFGYTCGSEKLTGGLSAKEITCGRNFKWSVPAAASSASSPSSSASSASSASLSSKGKEKQESMLQQRSLEEGMQQSKDAAAAVPLAFCGCQVPTYPTHYYYFVDAMLHQRKLRERTGIDFVPETNPALADVIFCRAQSATRLLEEQSLWSLRFDEADPGKQLLVLIEDHDAATVTAPVAAVLRKPFVVATLKHYAWTDFDGMCSSATFGSPMYKHVEFLRLLEEERSVGATKQSQNAVGALYNTDLVRLREALGELGGCPEMPLELRRKVLLSIPSWLTVRRGGTFPSFKKLPTLASRRYDVVFAGTINYTEHGNKTEPWQELITRARGHFFEELTRLASSQKWKVKLVTRVEKKANYYKLLQDAKLFISPWGLGEWSGKDEEAILAGAILVKPGAKLLQGAIPMYQPGVTCIDSHPDGRDLFEVVAAALAPSNLRALQEMQRRAHEIQRSYVSYAKAVNRSRVLDVWSDLAKRLQSSLEASGE